MKKHFVWAVTCSVLYVFAEFLGGGAASSSLAQTSGAVVFVHAVIIDGNAGVPVEDGTVVVRGQKVEAIGPTGTVQIPTNSRVIDVAGKVIMPALADMHVHLVGGWDGEAPDMLGYPEHCDSPIFIGGEIDRPQSGKVWLRIGLRLCPRHRPVRLRLSSQQSAGASPRSPAPQLLET
jgi:hypothetical protein